MAKKTKKTEIPVDNNIIEMPMEEAMPDNYLPYAVEVAKDRALPDVRDGLKPVHRRILYGAYMLKAFPDRPYYKSARIVGDILGKYHPHGDSSVYDAMVIMAQDFSTKEPLFQGHGNFGSMDGDSAAAMRYTEARLSNIALEMLRDIEKDTVDFVPNYSDSEMEPTVLPSRYPNLLVNGTFGIAVGLATNIPPHNLGEVIDGTCALIDNKDLTTKDLMNYIKGPDLPTRGELIGSQSLLSAYETGEGKVALRAKTSIETLENGRLGIVINEFPFRRNKAKLLQTISDMTGDKKHQKALEAITDIRDESDRNGIRAVIEFRKSADQTTVDTVLKYLLKKTDLQINLSFNMVAIANGKPETLGLKSILEHYINHQKVVIKRRTKNELEKAEARFHIVEGFIKAMSILDEVVATIRASKSKQDSKDNLVAKFGFTEPQAEAIVTLMLYRLTNLELNAFEKEYKELKRQIKRLNDILKKESVLLDLLKVELTEIKEKYASERKTHIIHDESEAKIDVQEIIIDEDVVITQSNDGFMKRIPVKSYNRTSGDVSDIENRDDDYTKFVYNANTKDTVLFFTETGSMYQMKAVNIPEMKWKEKGVRINELVRAKGIEDENILLALPIKDFNDNKDIIMITKKGNFKRFSINKLETRNTKRVASSLRKGDSIAAVIAVDTDFHPSYLEVTTEKGLKFVILEKAKENVEISTIPQNFISVADSDNIVLVTIAEQDYTSMVNIGIDSNNVVYVSKEPCNKDKNYTVNKKDYIMSVTNKGNVLTIPAFMVSHSKTVDLKAFVDEPIVSTFVVKSHEVENNAIFFFSHIGNVKKVSVSEFTNTIFLSGYKLKADETIVYAENGIIDESDLFIFTKKGMCLRFKDEVLTTTTKNALGVNGIRIKDDVVVAGAVIDTTKSTEIRINGNKRPLNLSNIEYKNKGTIGVSCSSTIKEVAITTAN